jgi:autotransporter-associated beta strand protein
MHNIRISTIRCFLGAIAIALFVAPMATFAASAQWDSAPASDDWNTALNWTPAAVPNGSSDTATFDLSDITNVSISADTEVDGIVFNSGASAYTITVAPAFTLTISGVGVVNNSGGTQNFVTNGATDSNSIGGIIDFSNTSSAGDAVFTINAAGAAGAVGSYTFFADNATADHATFVINGGFVSNTVGGELDFSSSSTAASGTFTINGGTIEQTLGGITQFFDNATAGEGSFTVNGGTISSGNGGRIFFNNNATADNATFVTNGSTGDSNDGGAIFFLDDSTAGNGTFVNNGGTVSSGGNGSAGGMQFAGNSTASNAVVTNNGGTGSDTVGAITNFIENSTAENATLIANGGSDGGGGGTIAFYQDSTGGSARVEVFGNGSLDISSHLPSGVAIGSLEGTGNVFLGANNLTIGSNNLSTTFSGVIQDPEFGGDTLGGSLTKIGSGTLTLSGANTYTGATTVNGGMLVVDGSITSAVTVNGGALGGSGTTRAVTVNSGGTLSPGNSPGILNVQGDLTLTLGATCLVDLNGAAVGTQYDQVNVTGIVSLGNATLSLQLAFTPTGGTMFKVINNDLTDSVVGIFNGLAEGATFTVNGQAFSISYIGGDGNDVVVTAVPEPGTWALLLAGSAALIARRIFRKVPFI